MTSRRNLLLLVIAAAILVYANSVWNGFAYDDTWIIAHNDRVHQLANLRIILFTPYWPSFGSELGLYRPFTILAFALEWAIGGGAPWVFHLTNVLLHAAACFLVFHLIERLINTRAAFAGALLFAVHPLHTEAVANVVGQGELWATIGVLTACIIYVNRPEGVAIDLRRRVLILVLYGVSLLAKESAVVLPGLLVLLDFAQARVQPTKHSMARYVHEIGFFIAMFCLVLAAYLTLRLSILGNITGTDAAPGMPFLREQYRLLNAVRAWPEFVRLLFLPLVLSVDYAPGVILPVESVTPMVALGMVLVGACVMLALATPWRPLAGLIAGWFLISILPVSNFFFPIGVLIAERTLYLPSVAVCILAGIAFAEALKSTERETRRLAIAAVAIITVVFGFRTVKRNPDWDSLTTVWESLARDHPESYRSQWVNALGLWSRKKNAQAEQYFLIAEKIWPRDSQFLTEFGNFYIGQRQYDKAVSYLERSRQMTPFVPRTHEFLGSAYLGAGRPADALASALHASGMEGADRSLTFTIIAGAYDGMHRYDEAVGAWRAAIQNSGGNVWMNWATLARSLAASGRKDEAAAAADVAFRKAKDKTSKYQVERLRAAIRSGSAAPETP